MVAFLVTLHVIVSIALILIVLLQPGNKEGMGAAMGGGGSSTVFGGSGANTFLSKLTAGLAFVFMLNSLVLVFVSSSKGSVTDKLPAVEKKADDADQAATAEPENKGKAVKDDKAAAEATAPAAAADTQAKTEEKAAPAAKAEGKAAAAAAAPTKATDIAKTAASPKKETPEAAPAANPKAAEKADAPAAKK